MNVCNAPSEAPGPELPARAANRSGIQTRAAWARREQAWEGAEQK